MSVCIADLQRVGQITACVCDFTSIFLKCGCFLLNFQCENWILSKCVIWTWTCEIGSLSMQTSLLQESWMMNPHNSHFLYYDIHLINFRKKNYFWSLNSVSNSRFNLWKLETYLLVSLKAYKNSTTSISLIFKFLFDFKGCNRSELYFGYEKIRGRRVVLKIREFLFFDVYNEINGQRHTVQWPLLTRRFISRYNYIII